MHRYSVIKTLCLLPVLWVWAQVGSAEPAAPQHLPEIIQHARALRDLIQSDPRELILGAMASAVSIAMLAPICLFPVAIIALYAAARQFPHDLKGRNLCVTEPIK
jgi:hypothetical protein